MEGSEGGAPAVIKYDAGNSPRSASHRPGVQPTLDSRSGYLAASSSGFRTGGSGDAKRLEKVTRFHRQGQPSAGMAGLNSTITPPLSFYLDREQANTLGVPVRDVFRHPETLFGSMYISQFNKFSRVFPGHRPGSTGIRSAGTSEGIRAFPDRWHEPLEAVVKLEYSTARIDHPLRNFPAAKVTGAAAWLQLGQALNTMEAVARGDCRWLFLCLERRGVSGKSTNLAGHRPARFSSCSDHGEPVLAAQYENGPCRLA